MFLLHHPVRYRVSPVAGAMAALSLCACAAALPGPGGVVIDGDLAEWSGCAPAMTDPAGDHNPASVDIRSLSIRHDADFVFFRLEVDRPVNLQHVPGTLHLVLDVDGDTATGVETFALPGSDVVVQFPPPRVEGKWSSGMGVGLISTTSDAALSPYEADFMFAPTYAASAFELRIGRGVSLRDRATARLFTGDTFSGRLVLTSHAGQMLDDSDSFTYELTEVKSTPPPAQTDDPLARADEALRIVTWNAEFSTIFEAPEAFARVLKALDADVILWQELASKSTGEDLRRWFDQYVAADGETYNAMVARGGGNLRCGIVSRYPIADIEPLDFLPYPDAPNRSLRVAGAVAMIDGRRMIFVSTHFKCCGALDTSEDDKRRVEAHRLSAAVTRAVDLAKQRGEPIHGVIIGGDLNLVGGYDPLEMLASGIDLDQSDMLILNPMQLDGGSNITWRGNAGKNLSEPQRWGPFAPGRLDFMLISDATLTAEKTFVFDAQDLAPRWREQHGVRLTDTDQASDHLPVVVDVGWK